MPTKEIGPAKAVTQADRTLESKISATPEPPDVHPHAQGIALPQLIGPHGLGQQKSPDQHGHSTTVTAMTRTFYQVMPEKLPMDQLWRFTMLASSAKVTTKSVTAEQM